MSLLEELSEIDPVHQSIYMNKDYDDYEKSINMSSEDSSDDDEQVEIMGVDGNLIKKPKKTVLQKTQINLLKKT
jgi:hypothetical protein